MKIINHPVHIVDDNGDLMPSAFIPFCSIGSNLTSLGVKHEKFSMPICNKFQAKMLNGQRCYQLDLQDVKDNIAFNKGELNGLTFMMDYSEDKMINTPSTSLKSLEKNIEGAISTKEATIYVDTLGQSTHDYCQAKLIIQVDQIGLTFFYLRQYQNT